MKFTETVRSIMKEYYYCLDGQTTDGPHSEGEIAELFHSGVLKPETLDQPSSILQEVIQLAQQHLQRIIGRIASEIWSCVVILCVRVT